MKIFATDLDGCLMNLNVPMAQAYSDILGVEIKAEDFTTWDTNWALGISPESTKPMWSKLWATPAKPYPGANVFLDCLKHLGYEVVIITSRPNIEAAEGCQRDIKQLENYDGLIIMDNKEKAKSHYVSEIGATWYLDDNIEYAVDVKLNSPCCTSVFLLDRPWNQNCKDIVGYRRLYSYADVLQYLSQHPQ